MLEALLARPGTARPEARALLPGVELAATLSGHALTLRLKGPGVTPEFRDRVLGLLAELRPGA